MEDGNRENSLENSELKREFYIKTFSSQVLLDWDLFQSWPSSSKVYYPSWFHFLLN